jgi:bifunctional NMN adenylyltransferase/nudix hydrolase
MKVGVIVGRFQSHTLHSGHESLIDTVVELNEVTVIFLGVSRAPGTKRNPLDFLTRRQMLEAYIESNVSEAKQVLILPILDQHDDTVWSKLLDEAIHAIGIRNAEVTIYGGRDSFLSRYKGSHKTKEFADLGSNNISSTMHREAVQVPIPSEDFRAGVIYATQTSFRSVFSTVDAALIKPSEKKVLLGKKSKETHWRFPGGFVDASDQSLECAVAREAYEETGYNIAIDSWWYISSCRGDDWRYPGPERIHTAFFAADVDRYQGGGTIQAGDDLVSIDWHNIDYDLLNKMVRTHKNLVTDLLVWFKRNFKIPDLAAGRK